MGSDFLFYGLDALKKSQGDKENLREVAIVGHEAEALLMTLNFSDWFSDARNRLFLISHESKPFEALMSQIRPEVARKLHDFFKKAEEDFTVATEVFMKKLREWQSLDDFVQVKIPRPTEPIPRLVFFMGHNASAIDQLIDNKRVFLTLETSDFRTTQVQSENNLLELKTIGVDTVLVGNGFKDHENLLDENEVGYFRIRPRAVIIENNWQKDFGELNVIENDIFKLFSPAESH